MNYDHVWLLKKEAKNAKMMWMSTVEQLVKKLPCLVAQFEVKNKIYETSNVVVNKG